MDGQKNISTCWKKSTAIDFKNQHLHTTKLAALKDHPWNTKYFEPEEIIVIKRKIEAMIKRLKAKKHAKNKP